MKYKDFFKIRQRPVVANNDSLVLDFHFSVLAPSDAHILLAPSAEVAKGDPVYEVVIGAGNNAFSDIRRGIKAQVKASSHTIGILSWMDIKSFWIHINKGEVAFCIKNVICICVLFVKMASLKLEKKEAT